MTCHEEEDFYVCTEHIRTIYRLLVVRVWTGKVHYCQVLRDSNDKISQLCQQMTWNQKWELEVWKILFQFRVQENKWHCSIQIKQRQWE